MKSLVRRRWKSYWRSFGELIVARHITREDIPPVGQLAPANGTILLEIERRRGRQATVVCMGQPFCLTAIQSAVDRD